MDDEFPVPMDGGFGETETLLNDFLEDPRHIVDDNFMGFDVDEFSNYLDDDNAFGNFGSPDSDRSDPSTSSSVDSGYSMDFDIGSVKGEIGDELEMMQIQPMGSEVTPSPPPVYHQQNFLEQKYTPQPKLVQVKSESVKARSNNGTRLPSRGIRLSKLSTSFLDAFVFIQIFFTNLNN